MVVASLLVALIVTTGPVLAVEAPRESAVVHVESPRVGWTIARLDTITSPDSDAHEEYMSLGPREDLGEFSTGSVSP